VTFAQSHSEKNVLFENQSGRLQRKEGSGLELLGNSRSGVYFDADLDGDLDVAVNNYHGPAVLLKNEAGSASGNWLKIRLIGDPSKGVTRDAVGARIVASGKSLKPVWREVHGTIGFLSVHPKEQHFGVGTAETVDLTVTWPSGETQHVKNLSVNSAYSLSQNQQPHKL